MSKSGTKVCFSCKAEKPIAEFRARAQNKDGLHSYCLPCERRKNSERWEKTKEEQLKKHKAWREANKERVAQRSREYAKQNAERLREYHKEYREQNKEKLRQGKKEHRLKTLEHVRERDRKYREQNKEAIYEKNRQYRKANKEKIKARESDPQSKAQKREYMKAYRAKNKERILQKTREYREKNADSVREAQRDYAERNRERIRKRRRGYNKAWMKERCATDPKFNLNQRMSTAIYQSLKAAGSSKNGRGWSEHVGYTAQDLMAHLESKFDSNMNWENHGTYWHIDHIKPKSWFTYTSPDDPQFKECWSLANLQPLEAKQNIRKSNKYEG
jgi:hypothetical protein